MNFNVDNTNNPFLLSPDEVKLHFLSYLPHEDLVLRVSLVCRDLLLLVKDEILWKERIVRRLGTVRGKQFFETFIGWKAAYVNYIKMSREGKIISSGEIISHGEKRIGEFQNGKLNGQGKRIFPNRTTWEGTFKDNELIHGKMTFFDKEIWEGEFTNGKLNGLGRITYPNKEVWEGTFKDSILHGQGKITFPTGETREGKFRDDRLNGQGKITFPNKEVWEGEFQDERLNGQGRKIWWNGEVWEGTFKEGLFREFI